MKTTKEIIHDFIQCELYNSFDERGGLTTSFVADALKIQRTNASAALNELVKEGLLEKSKSRPVIYSLTASAETVHSFDKLVGANGSLKNAIQLAKAAILYPNQSLNVIISANPGSGTTVFVDKMFEFSKESGILGKDAPFVKVNCKRYSKDITALNGELFGEEENFKNSVFEKSWNGLLFMDHYDLLDVGQQSKVLEFLDTGVGALRKCHAGTMMVVLSCSAHSGLDVNRKIPMKIELPTLMERPHKERFELINHFFSMEAYNSQRSIIVTGETIKALLLSEFSFNAKELELEIKSACANAYVRVVMAPNEDIVVQASDFKSNIKKGLLKIKDNYLIIEELLGSAETVVYDKDTGYLSDQGTDSDQDMYREIEKQYDELAKRGIQGTSITGVINAYIKNLFDRYSYHRIMDEKNNLEQLSKIVNPDVIEAVSLWLDSCKKQLSRNFKANVFYGLCIHVNSLLSSNHTRKKIPNDKITEIIQNYPDEYALTLQFSAGLHQKFSVQLAMEEIMLIMMFLIKEDVTEETGNPVLLYVLHGKGVASALAETTNRFTQSNNIYSYELLLEVDTHTALHELKALLLKIDQGQGVIVIYDMGSIKTMIEMITDETNMKIRLIHMPITMVGIEAARKAAMETDIDYVYHMLNTELNSFNAEVKKQNSLIITLCHTGEGGAEQLRRYIDQYSKIGMKVKALSISDRNELVKEVLELREIYQIHAFIGTYDPKLFGIPFISIGKIFESSRKHLDRIIMFEPVTSKYIEYADVYDYLETQFSYTSIAKLKTVLPEIIDQLDAHYALLEDQKVGLFMHLACLVERLLEGNFVAKNENKQKMLQLFPEEYKVISRILKKLEKTFKIIIDDNELATIIMIIKKI
ncbi:transcriptional regulatory protein LevR [Trichococcus patagoniensis]|uniref:Transcriptional regulatory protein LevR n=1 Tax=Trichococcus patagoniensis TaxID=382641 RepID=A0A2T5IM89_9LACT|nr:PRD domain-containing protein [Trichococcus patagoniensis]PTQ84945.1 transcriptional regulatory protein LevR [Trichococcus patagoniensis]